MVRSSTNSYAYASHSNNRPDTNQSSIEMRDREARLADSLRRNRPLRWHTVSAGRETLPAYAEFGADVPPTPVQPEPAHVANPAAAPPPASAPQNQDLEAQNERPVRYPRYYGRIEVCNHSKHHLLYEDVPKPCYLEHKGLTFCAGLYRMRDLLGHLVDVFLVRH